MTPPLCEMPEVAERLRIEDMLIQGKIIKNRSRRICHSLLGAGIQEGRGMTYGSAPSQFSSHAEEIAALLATQKRLFCSFCHSGMTPATDTREAWCKVCDRTGSEMHPATLKTEQDGFNLVYCSPPIYTKRILKCPQPLKQ